MRDILCNRKILSRIDFPLHIAEYQVWLQANLLMQVQNTLIFHHFVLHKWQLHSMLEVIEAFAERYGLLIRVGWLLGWLISQKALYLQWLCGN